MERLSVALFGGLFSHFIFDLPHCESIIQSNPLLLPLGGVESAFRHVDPTAYKPRLLHLKGKRNVRITQVELKSSSLNEGRVGGSSLTEGEAEFAFFSFFYLV